MRHIDLTVSENYVPSWGVWEGVRELMQNAFDRERETEDGRDPVKRFMSDHRVTITYGEDEETLVISNADTVLDRRTIILGEGTKREGGDTIGQHGEGYKLAMLALTRKDRPVTVHTGDEEWSCSFVENETLGCRVLRITFGERPASDGALRFVVRNVTTRDWSMIRRNVRRLHESGEEFVGDGGSLLVDNDEGCRLYVGGLFVQELRTRYLYGYDFNPDVLHLDRDRQRVGSFDLDWAIGTLLASVGLDAKSFVMRTIVENTPECQYLLSRSGDSLDEACEEIYQNFRAQHGEFAYPVDTEYRASDLRMKHGGAVRPVIVDAPTMKAFQRSASFREWIVGLPTTERKAPPEVLRLFLDEHREYFPQTLADAFATELVDRSESEGWAAQ